MSKDLLGFEIKSLIFFDYDTFVNYVWKSEINNVAQCE